MNFNPSSFALECVCLYPPQELPQEFSFASQEIQNRVQQEEKQLSPDNYAEIFKILIKQSDFKTVSCLAVANHQVNQIFKSRCTNIFAELIGQGADFSSNNQKAIRWAAENNHSEVVKLLLQDKKIDPFLDIASPKNPFHIACQKNHLEVVQIFLEDSRATDAFFKCIELVCEKGYLPVFELMLKNERMELLWNIHGITYLDVAMEKAEKAGQKEIVQLLLRDGRAKSFPKIAIRLGP
jgi:ankyrin repeat protein